MKLTPDDPRLSSYLLGELPPEEALLIEQAASEDPAIRASLDNLEKFHAFMKRTLSPQTQALLPHQRAAILEASRGGSAASGSCEKVVRFPWMVAAAAAVVAVGTWLLWPKTEAPAVAQAAAPEASSVVVANDDEVVFAERDGEFTNFSVKPVVRLPVHAKNRSLARLEQSVLDKNRLPDAGSLRFQEVANAFVPPMPAVCAVADLQLSGTYLQPGWKNGNRWLGMVVENRGARDREVKLELSDPVANGSYRIAATSSSRPDSRAAIKEDRWQKLAPGERTVVWVEHMAAAAPSKAADEALKVELRTREEGKEQVAGEWQPKEVAFAQAPRSTQRSLMLMGWAMRVHGGEWGSSAPAPEELKTWITSGPVPTTEVEVAVDQILRKGAALLNQK